MRNDSFVAVFGGNITKKSTPNKGKFKGNCNRTDCQSPLKVVWYNQSTGKYYCEVCAELINKVNKYPNSDIELCINKEEDHV